jgi:preprotein translocase subunit SecD
MAEHIEKESESEGTIRAFRAVVIVIVGILMGYFVYSTTLNTESKYPFKLGLDLAGGSHLVYEADVTELEPEDVPGLMNVLRDVIERRVNVFGVSEPIVQVERSSFVAEVPKERLVVELPGVTDVEQAVREIGKTPLLEFKLVNQEALVAQNATSTSPEENLEPIDPYIVTGLTGRYLKRSELVFGQANQGGLSNEPIVSIEFTEEGAALFEEITRNNTGEQLAIFLDGVMMSAPRINEAIGGGKAIISGNFTPDEARELVRNLNFGALPVPIQLVSTQTIGASLGSDILEKGVRAGVIGFVIVILFMIIWYRVPGLIAGLALLFYAAIVLSLFKFIPVTITAAGLAGFILSLGMAVDANVLVFERMKEEYLNGKDSREAARVGFLRAWSAIRDSNMTSIFSAIILFWFGTSVVKGFALVFGIGVLASMLSAITVTRTLLIALPSVRQSDATLLARLFGTGLRK